MWAVVILSVNKHDDNDFKSTVHPLIKSCEPGEIGNGVSWTAFSLNKVLVE
jgi:hypothetical protein